MRSRPSWRKLSSAPDAAERDRASESEDVSRCSSFRRTTPSPFAELAFTADGNIGRGECLVETPKGIVRSFLEEHLEHIREALQRWNKPWQRPKAA